ncbi:CobW family GTP-binding protein [Mucilaginibacter sp. UYCu711]|uniref:CobW family GTP-binding protein n=1 Tax=Mucilaginibacter sp. UYCu711 TaxID=3156339 RepID=UPI003D250CB9
MIAKPVSIITGFLGAGKTTVLNQIIRERPETRYAIIENEIGQESIDAELILKNQEDIIELNDGCLCCSLSDGLFDILNALWDRKAEWDELIIEATGIADPAGIAQPFLVNPQIRAAFVLQRVICVVDVQLIEDQLRETDETIRQISFSDIILLNKTENISDSDLNNLKDTLGKINPFATIIVSNRSDLQIDTLLNHERSSNFAKNPKIINSKFGALSLSPSILLNKQSAITPGVNYKHHHSNIVTLFIKFKGYLNIRELEHRLYVFLVFQSKDVYRIKGIINVKDAEEKFIIQSVVKSVAISSGSRWETGEERENKIIIIGKNLVIEPFEKLFKGYLIS